MFITVTDRVIRAAFYHVGKDYLEIGDGKFYLKPEDRNPIGAIKKILAVIDSIEKERELP